MVGGEGGCRSSTQPFDSTTDPVLLKFGTPSQPPYRDPTSDHPIVALARLARSSSSEVAPRPETMRSLRQRETAQIAVTLSRQLNAIHVPREPGSRISGIWERYDADGQA